MSITKEELDKVKSSLQNGDYTRIAKNINTSQPWISKVFADLLLANRNPHVISAALDIIEERKASEKALINRIEDVING
jgi:hypothetical protein